MAEQRNAVPPFTDTKTPLATDKARKGRLFKA